MKKNRQDKQEKTMKMNIQYPTRKDEGKSQ